jgi:hypothetical protein
MKKIFLFLFLAGLTLNNTQLFAQSSQKKIVLCESYSTTGVPSGINSSWVIKEDGGYVYILYTNGNTAINKKETLWLYIDKKYEDGEYGAYATEEFVVNTGDKFVVYDYKFTEEGDYKIIAYQDGVELAITYANISFSNNQGNTTTTQNNNNSNKKTDATIVTCESNNDYGAPTGIYSIWNITDEANLVNILFQNGKTINKEKTLYLYVDKKQTDGTYSPYGTEKFEVKSGKSWANFYFAFKDEGEYKVSAVQSLDELATTYVTINKKNSNQTSIDNTKSIVTCSEYDNNTGKPSGIYDTWNISESGGYVYIVFNNGIKIKGTHWLYIDKYDEDSKDYTAYETKTFETNGKSWASYKFTFTENGKYKISAVSSKGEEASTIVNVNFNEGVKNIAKKSIVLCDSYDDYGKPIGINEVWNIEKNDKGGWIYILFDNGEKMTGTTSLYVDKKNTNGEYVPFDTKSFTNTNKNWSVYDYNFKEIGEYKISAYKDGNEIATTNATIKYNVTNSTTKIETPKYQEDITTWYYDGSEVFFAEEANASGTLKGKNTTFNIPSTGKKLTMVYKQGKAIKTNKIIVDVWTGVDYVDFVETKEFVTLPTQKDIYIPYTFKKAGKYKLSVYNQDEIFMNYAEVEIKVGTTNVTTTTTTSSSVKNNNNVPTTNQNSIYNSLSFNPVNNVENRTALVIGNGNYVSAGKLPNPVHDAEEVSKALQACGFKVNLLINASKKQMNEAVKQFGIDIANNKGTGLVFYAGHGIQSKGENYLIPIDAEIFGEEDLQYECVNVNQLLSKMEVAKNNMNIIMLDACRNNPFERSWNRSTNGNGLASLNAPDGTIIAFSTNPGNVASDGTGYNSPYTTALLNQLKKPNLTIEQVLKGVAGQVKKETPGQLPWYSSSITGEFYFRP